MKYSSYLQAEHAYGPAAVQVRQELSHAWQFGWVPYVPDGQALAPGSVGRHTPDASAVNPVSHTHAPAFSFLGSRHSVHVLASEQLRQ